MIVLSRLAAAAALGATAWAAGKFSKEQLGARFHYDLGPSRIDVSAYPGEQQANYAVFAKACSQCHTLARPINSPVSSRKDWRRYVLRMHLKTKAKRGTSVSPEEAKAIVDFLAYDAKRRKVDGKADFEAKDAELRKIFEAVKKERGRLRIEEDKKKVKEYPMGDGLKPHQ